VVARTNSTDRLFAGLGTARVRMTDDETRLLVEAIQEHSGITLSINSGFFLERRLSSRLDALGLSSYLDYYQYLRYDPAGPREMEELVERITTHETYLFREQYQLEAFSEEILPALAKRLERHQRIQVWSAGCSTGEEVYTIAMLLLESGLFRGWNIRVMGSDISRKVLATARAAVYGENSFRTTTPALRRKYFVEANGRWTVRDDVRAMCSFGQLNLISTERFRVLGPQDVVFCRNVLMYLSQEARHRVVEAFYDRLTPGGFLLLGHSESLLNVTTRFDLAHLQKDLVYRKPDTATQPSSY
jgi:chemotaxis protein methyltransferase CheR